LKTFKKSKRNEEFYFSYSKACYIIIGKSLVKKTFALCKAK